MVTDAPVAPVIRCQPPEGHTVVRGMNTAMYQAEVIEKRCAQLSMNRRPAELGGDKNAPCPSRQFPQNRPFSAMFNWPDFVP